MFDEKIIKKKRKKEREAALKKKNQCEFQAEHQKKRHGDVSISALYSHQCLAFWPHVSIGSWVM